MSSDNPYASPRSTPGELPAPGRERVIRCDRCGYEGHVLEAHEGLPWWIVLPYALVCMAICGTIPAFIVSLLFPGLPIHGVLPYAPYLPYVALASIACGGMAAIAVINIAARATTETCPNCGQVDPLSQFQGATTPASVQIWQDATLWDLERFRDRRSRRRSLATLITLALIAIAVLVFALN